MLPTDRDPPESPKAPSYRLHGIWQMFVAALLGSPLPAFWMAAINFGHLGREADARKSLGLGLALTAANLAVAFFAPENVPHFAIALPFVFATKLIMQSWFQPVLAQHRATGGELASWGAAIGYGLLSLILVVLVIVGIVWLIEF